MSQPIRLIRKTVWSDIFLVRNFLVVEEEKNCQKKCMVGEKKLSEFFFVRNFFWSEKNLGLKEEFGLKKTFVGKFFWSEGQGWHFRGPEKHFAFFFKNLTVP